MPGNQGGSNWGTTAADPQSGLVFVISVNQVAILRLEDVKDPPAQPGRGGGGGNQVDAALARRVSAPITQHCAACHGADQRGAIPGVPSLVGVTDRIDEESLRVIVSEGRNNMRPILDASNEEIRAIYAYLQITNPIRPGRRRRGVAAARGSAAAAAARPVVGQRRRAAAAAAAALRRPVLPGRRRHGRQHAVAGRRGGREAADAVPDRLQRHGDVHQAAVHDASPPTT